MSRPTERPAQAALALCLGHYKHLAQFRLSFRFLSQLQHSSDLNFPYIKMQTILLEGDDAIRAK